MDIVSIGQAVAQAIKKADTRYNRRAAVTSAAPQIGLTQSFVGATIIGVFGTTLIRWSSFGIAQSDDGGQSWAGKTVPGDVATTYVSAGKARMLAFKGYWYLSCLNSSGVASVYRTPVVPRGTAFTWSAALKTMESSGAAVISTAFSTDGTNLYWGEYGDPSGGPKFYRSSNGTTWTAQSMSAYFTRHIHCIAPDPYNPGQLWMTGGDGGSAAYHLRSTDYGATWTVVPGALGTTQLWQTVQVSFDKDNVWFAPDTPTNWTVARAARSDLVPRWYGRGSHRLLPVPQGLPPRKVTDLVTTAQSTTVTSATAAFTAADIGSKIRSFGQDFVPIGSYIMTVPSSTTATISSPATAGGSGITAVVGGETFGAMAYYGAIDPTTGIYYFATINGAIGGNVDGLFAVLVDGSIVLLDLLTTSPDGGMVIDAASGRLYVLGFWRPLLSVA